MARVRVRTKNLHALAYVLTSVPRGPHVVLTRTARKVGDEYLVTVDTPHPSFFKHACLTRGYAKIMDSRLFM